MTKRKQRTTTTVYRDLRLMILTDIGTIPVFLCAQLLLRNGIYGLPVMVVIVLITATYTHYSLWRALTATTALMLYMSFLMLGLAYAVVDPVLLAMLTLCCLLPAAAFIGHRIDRLREKSMQLGEQSSRERLISDINTQLLTVSSPEELQRLTLKYIYNVSSNAAVYYRLQSGVALRVASNPDGLIVFNGEQEAAQAAFATGKRTGFQTSMGANSSFCYLPVLFKGRVLAVVGVLNDPEKPMSAQMLHTLELILLRVAVVLEKQRLTEEHRQVSMERELEHMRSDFLRAISHDFRTPLTGIIGACSALEQQDVPLEPQVRKELIDSIDEEAAWLLRMVENLLSVTRVGDCAPELNKSLEPVEEVLAEAIRRAKARFPDACFHLSQPDTFLMVPMDPMLIVQVLMNLLENAVKYTGSDAQIDITVTEVPSGICFTVRDYGKGLSDRAIDTLFQPSAGRSGDSTHGMGLGLSICRSVIVAHGGTIEGGNSAEGGAEFRFTLPKEESV